MRNYVMALLQFFCALRIGSLLAIKRSHISFNDPPGHGADCFIARSKTGPYTQPIPEATADRRIPVTPALRAFLAIAPSDDGPLFRGTMKTGHTQTWQPPNRIVRKGRYAGKTVPNPLSTSAWIEALRDAIKKADPACNAALYTSHSLRSGAATALVEAGGSIDDARQLLNHKSETAVAHYVKANPDRRRRVAGTMLGLK
jgi:integrase